MVSLTKSRNIPTPVNITAPFRVAYSTEMPLTVKSFMAVNALVTTGVPSACTPSERRRASGRGCGRERKNACGRERKGDRDRDREKRERERERERKREREWGKGKTGVRGYEDERGRETHS